jgi:hypothetical protein
MYMYYYFYYPTIIENLSKIILKILDSVKSNTITSDSLNKKKKKKKKKPLHKNKKYM